MRDSYRRDSEEHCSDGALQQHSLADCAQHVVPGTLAACKPSTIGKLVGTTYYQHLKQSARDSVSAGLVQRFLQAASHGLLVLWHLKGIPVGLPAFYPAGLNSQPG